MRNPARQPPTRTANRKGSWFRSAQTPTGDDETVPVVVLVSAMPVTPGLCAWRARCRANVDQPVDQKWILRGPNRGPLVDRWLYRQLGASRRDHSPPISETPGPSTIRLRWPTGCRAGAPPTLCPKLSPSGAGTGRGQQRPSKRNELAVVPNDAGLYPTNLCQSMACATVGEAHRHARPGVSPDGVLFLESSRKLLRHFALPRRLMAERSSSRLRVDGSPQLQLACEPDTVVGPMRSSSM
ncbi:MAG: hypothetical protein QOE61_2595 [Micromonosporaceae bacterium]|jgi:hypothetical protein|nr:hypothetical protein [Micromonosporaceae bacterium]